MFFSCSALSSGKKLTPPMLTSDNIIYVKEIWKIWVHLVLSSNLALSKLTVSDPSLTHLTIDERIIPSKQLLQEIEPFRKQNHNLSQLIQLIESNTQELTSSTAKRNQKEQAIKLIRIIARLLSTELIVPTTGVGILVHPLQSFMKISRFDATECYYHLTKLLLSSSSSSNHAWHIPNGPSKLLLRFIHHVLVGVQATSLLKDNKLSQSLIEDYCSSYLPFGKLMLLLISRIEP
jgi:hypothetical protein